MRYLVVAFIAIVVSLGGSTVGASDARLRQEVVPILCVFTVTDAGTTTSDTTVCDNDEAPTITSVKAAITGRPTLAGRIASPSFKRFRAWIGNQWYTHNVSPYMAITGDSWKLDLTPLETPLAAGDYTVVIELLTNNNYLLRSVYNSIFTVPFVTVIDTQTDAGPGIVTHDRFVRSSTGSILDDYALANIAKLPSSGNGLQSAPAGLDALHRDAPLTRYGNLMLIILGAVALVAISAAYAYRLRTSTHKNR